MKGTWIEFRVVDIPSETLNGRPRRLSILHEEELLAYLDERAMAYLDEMAYFLLDDLILLSASQLSGVLCIDQAGLERPSIGSLPSGMSS